MSRINLPLIAFNRGVVSPLALARTDIRRIGLSAETQTNWMPRSLGSMMLRPGLQHIGSTKSNAKAHFIPFVFAADDTALIELTNLVMRIWVSDVVLARVAVTAAITNGAFTSDITSWTDADEAGATSDWSGGQMTFVGTGFNRAIRYQLVTLGGSDSGKTHAVNVRVFRGKVLLRIGSTLGGQEYVSETELREGYHSIGFVPTTDFYIEVSSRTQYLTYLDSIVIASAGAVEVTSPWATANLDNVRYDQSGDVVFVACKDVHPYRIERRDNGSWSVVIYQPEDGPFLIENLSSTFLTASATTGNVTITASQDTFKSSNVGSIYSVDSVGQKVVSAIAGADQWTDSILVTGFTPTERRFAYAITGTWVGTVTLQRSVGVTDAWVEVDTYTANGSGNINDGLADQSVYYRIGIDTGDYTSGTANVSLTFDRGSITGFFRIEAFSTSKSVSVSVLKALGNITASQVWAEGAWSSRRGWPSAVALFEGRLWWAGMDHVWGSVSDAYESFLSNEDSGDSGPIERSIGSGPVETIQWLLPLQRLLAGGQAAEFSIRSSSFDEPITPTNFSIKPPSTQGSASVAAMRVDSSGIFVQRGGARIYLLDFAETYYDYAAVDLTLYAPELCAAGVVSLSVQRQPDTRVHAVLADGTVAVLIYEKLEQERCWVKVSMSADTVIQAVVLPGTSVEDQVYYQVKLGSSYYLAKWAKESECQGGTLNKQADMFVSYTGGAITALTGLSHLNGRTGVIWADGAYRGTAAISGGSITLGGSYTNVVVGLGYQARYKSVKLAYANEQLGTALLQRKRVAQLGVIMTNTHYQGLRYGPDFTTMDELPLMYEDALTAANTIHSTFDTDPFEFPGEWGTDSRVCLEANAPKPCTLLAMVLALDTEDGFTARTSRGASLEALLGGSS